jgi:hypothetical protein
VLLPGIHDGVPADAYHADEVADQPSLSASIAHLLCTSSPAHARAAHPKLNPGLEREEESKFDIGTVAHALLLQGDDIAVIIDAPDWRTKVAQEARDAARATGFVPLLVGQWERVQQMVTAAREQLATHRADPTPFTDGQPEQTLVWDDGGVACRARLDWIRDDRATIDDYKSTGASADPAKWVKTAYGIGADTQVAFYLRGCEKALGVRPAWRYVVQETYPPYALSVVDLAPSALAVGDDKVKYALDVWRRCLASGEWPAYTSRVASLEIPTFAELQWMERDAA